MGPFEILAIVLSIIVVIAVLIAFILSAARRKRERIIHEAFNELFPESNLKFHVHGHPHHLEIETDSKLYLVKVVPFNIQNELIITNKYFWCINSNPKGWSRNSKPVLVDGVKHFLDFHHESDQPVEKVALIYPGCRNITRYLNESDVELVTPAKPAYGVYFIRFSEIGIFFKN